MVVMTGMGLNGDLLLWNPILESVFEISSMGIRVDKRAMEYQLDLKGQSWKKRAVFGPKRCTGNAIKTV